MPFHIGAMLTEMAAFELTVRTAVRGYHVYKEVKLGTRNPTPMA